MLKWMRVLMVLAMACMMVFTGVACDNGGGAEEAGETIDDAVDDVKDGLEDAGDAIEDATDDATDDIKEDN